MQSDDNEIIMKMSTFLDSSLSSSADLKPFSIDARTVENIPCHSPTYIFDATFDQDTDIANDYEVPQVFKPFEHNLFGINKSVTKYFAPNHRYTRMGTPPFIFILHPSAFRDAIDQSEMRLGGLLWEPRIQAPCST